MLLLNQIALKQGVFRKAVIVWSNFLLYCKPRGLDRRSSVELRKVMKIHASFLKIRLIFTKNLGTPVPEIHCILENKALFDINCL